MCHIKKDKFRVSVSVVPNTLEILKFLKSFFPDIPRDPNVEEDIRYVVDSQHIHSCEARLGDELVGAAFFVFLNKPPESGIVQVPIEYEYRLNLNHSHRIHINYLAVKEEFRTIGIGKSIKLEIIKWANLNGVSIITANVRPDNIASRKMNLSAGFLECPERTIKGLITHYYPL